MWTNKDSKRSVWLYFLVLFFVSTALIFSILIYNHLSDVSRTKAAAAEAERQNLHSLVYALGQQSFSPLITDLMTLGSDPRVQSLINNPTEQAQKAVDEFMMNFARHKPIYDQVRLLDEKGLERVRVNRLGEQVVLIEKTKLQNKRGRYYFEETVKLAPQQVYISPFDLNVEHGEVEHPLKPMIRIGMPLFDQLGEPSGIILLNFLGQSVFDVVSSAMGDHRQVFMINEQGYWLLGPTPEQEWGFMFPEREDQRFEKDFPSIWPDVTEKAFTQRFVDQGLLSSISIKPFAEASQVQIVSEDKWVLISLLSNAALNEIPRAHLPERIFIGFILLVIAFLGAVFFSQAMVNRARMFDELKASDLRKEKLIDELKQAQAKLIQSEKLAGIGQLAAGVAHEINNPVGFIGSNINALHSYARELMEVIAELETIISENNTMEVVKDKMAAIHQHHDLDYLRDDMLPLLEETQDGIERIKRIVADLKGFARASDGQWEVVDLHTVIERTLNLIRNEVKYHCTVSKVFGELPLVECIPGEINQVLMNILVNASHAITENGLIEITTGTAGGRAWIAISDNGSGIAPEHIEHLFEPFFTTKPVGKGTGLGLSISYGIIKKHHGILEVESKLGVGTCFKITLPLSHTENEQGN